MGGGRVRGRGRGRLRGRGRGRVRGRNRVVAKSTIPFPSLHFIISTGPRPSLSKSERKGEGKVSL